MILVTMHEEIPTDIDIDGVAIQGLLTIPTQDIVILSVLNYTAIQQKKPTLNLMIHSMKMKIFICTMTISY